MPKAAAYTLTTSAADSYQLSGADLTVAPDGGAAWREWLEQHKSFAFVGRNGRLNLLKEARKGGDGYWYAYRRQGQNTAKRYAGRSAEVTPARLEGIAAALNGPGEPDNPPPAVVPQLAPPPLLAPKLQPPRLHSALVPRERLLAQLDAGLERKLTLIAAPAGFGKTTLVRQWVTAHEGVPQFPAVAWVALEAADNDPLRFGRYVIAACRRFGPEIGRTALALLPLNLQLQFKRAPLEAALTALLNDISDSGVPGVLVLEDYHTITAPAIHEALLFALEHLPATLHLIIITRNEPPLPLARLRAAGEVSEIGAPDLRFSPEEMRGFLRQATPFALPATLIGEIEARLEGWAAGLRMLGLALEGQSDNEQAERVLRGFSANPRAVQEYFVGEVLNAQPAELQDFLLQTSVLHTLTGSLCDAITGRRNGELLLEALDRAGLFLEPLDTMGLWYRYHALFAAAMQAEARRRFGADALRDLARLAGRWYESHSLLTEAVESALSAGDDEHAAALIERMPGPQELIFGSQSAERMPGLHTMRRWVETLPDEVLDRHPVLWLTHATTILFGFLIEMQQPDNPNRSRIAASLKRAEQGLLAAGDTARLGKVYAFRSMITKHRGESAQSADWANQALAILPAEDLAARAISLNSLAMDETLGGRLDTARVLLLDSVALCEIIGNPAFIRANRAMLAYVRYEQGEMRYAAEQFRAVLAEARLQGDMDDIARSQLALAMMAFEWNRLDEARERVAEALDVSTRFPYSDEARVRAVLLTAQLAAMGGDHEAAQRRIIAALTETDPRDTAEDYQLYRLVLEQQARLFLLAGDINAAARWANGRDIDDAMPPSQYDYEELLVARIRIAEDCADEALLSLEGLLDRFHEHGSKRGELACQALLALAHAANHESATARHMLAAALEYARDEGYMRKFIDLGAPMEALLRSTLPALRDRHLIAYARSILQAFAAELPPSAASAPFNEPLSQQEERVLRLLAAGRTNPEIAAELQVSVNTVKAHVKSIYRKLDISSRHEASELVRRRESLSA